MSQTQLESLTAFLKENVPARAMKGFDSVLDELKFINAAKDYGLDQYRQAVMRYDAVLTWERFPYRLCLPQLLMSLLVAWLDEADRDLLDEIGVTEADPDWDVTVEDEETATIVLTVPMAEELIIRKDPKGAIPWRGERWSIADVEIWTALTATVFGVDEAGAQNEAQREDAAQHAEVVAHPGNAGDSGGSCVFAGWGLPERRFTGTRWHGGVFPAKRDARSCQSQQPATEGGGREDGHAGAD